jgi:hypothetical protein
MLCKSVYNAESRKKSAKKRKKETQTTVKHTEPGKHTKTARKKRGRSEERARKKRGTSEDQAGKERGTRTREDAHIILDVLLIHAQQRYLPLQVA